MRKEFHIPFLFCIEQTTSIGHIHILIKLTSRGRGERERGEIEGRERERESVLTYGNVNNKVKDSKDLFENKIFPMSKKEKSVTQVLRKLSEFFSKSNL